MIGDDFVSLTWEKPKGDGGGRITGYIVEKREAGTSVWQRFDVFELLSVSFLLRCTITPHPSTIYNVSNLIEGRQYEFRVFAVNDAGWSEPSTNSSPITFVPVYSAKPPEVHFFFNFAFWRKENTLQIVKKLSDTAGEEGKPCKLTCEFTGNPAPAYKWYKGAREIYDSPKFTVISDGGRQTLIINELYGEDADEYSCRATNDGGVKSTRCDVAIKCALIDMIYTCSNVVILQPNLASTFRHVIKSPSRFPSIKRAPLSCRSAAFPTRAPYGQRTVLVCRHRRTRCCWRLLIGVEI